MSNDNTCPSCWGSGWETQFVTQCRDCNGTGKVLPSSQKEQPDNSSNVYIQHDVKFAGERPDTSQFNLAEAQKEQETTPDYSKGCARYKKITCDCDLMANECKGKDFELASLRQQLQEKDKEIKILSETMDHFNAELNKAKDSMKDFAIRYYSFCGTPKAHGKPHVEIWPMFMENEEARKKSLSNSEDAPVETQEELWKEATIYMDQHTLNWTRSQVVASLSNKYIITRKP